jgi:hypothetical protein
MDATIETGRNWLQQCLKEHDCCKKKATLAMIFSTDNMHIVRDLGNDDRMPRRLLWIDPGTGSEHLNLVEVGKATDEIPYIALSHSWGPGETFKTTTANIDKLKAGIRLSDLPRTFREAAEVTRGLGHEYLWIDSLCIIQDDPKDWKDEAPRMAVVYGNAVCSIMAMDSIDSYGGLLGDPNSKPGILLSRAWVVQERMIPSRTLVFTNNRVYWECRECDASQDNPNFVRRPPQNDAEKIPTHPKELFALMRDFRVEGLTENPDEHEFVEIYEGLYAEKETYDPFLKAWWEFVELYTPCKLSFESDKFLAVNGVAATTQRFTRLRNCWGLWRDFIDQDLLWSIDPKGPLSRRPKRWRAPFWSWASTEDGRVVNMYYKRLPVEPRLMLKPEIFVGVNTSFDQSLPIAAWSREAYKMELKGDLRSAELITELGDAGNPVYKISLESTSRFSDEEVHEFRPDAPLKVGSIAVQCLLFLHYDKDALGGDHYIDVRLVLLWIGDEGDENHDRVFERIGYLETTYKEMRDQDGINEDFWWKYVQLR